LVTSGTRCTPQFLRTYSFFCALNEGGKRSCTAGLTIIYVFVSVCATMELTQLPDEILLHIFRYLGAEELTMCNFVDSQLYRITNEEQLWRELVEKERLTRGFPSVLLKYLYNPLGTWKNYYFHLHRPRKVPGLQIKRGADRCKWRNSSSGVHIATADLSPPTHRSSSILCEPQSSLPKLFLTLVEPF